MLLTIRANVILIKTWHVKK